MVVMPGGDVWVLFRRREWRYAAAELARYPGKVWNAPQGLGRFSKGKWEFPVKLDGVPESRERVRQGPNRVDRWTEKLSITHLVGVGGKLFVADAHGVYAGPGKWQQIFESSQTKPSYPGAVQGIQRSPDDKALVIWERGQNSELRRHLYDVRTAKVTTSTIKRASYKDWEMARDAGYLLGTRRDHSWRQHWTKVPTAKGGLWVVGPLGTTRGYHTVVQTPWAVWIASRGELIRLDRKLLAEWLGNGRE